MLSRKNDDERPTLRTNKQKGTDNWRTRERFGVASEYTLCQLPRGEIRGLLSTQKLSLIRRLLVFGLIGSMETPSASVLLLLLPLTACCNCFLYQQ